MALKRIINLIKIDMKRFFTLAVALFLCGSVMAFNRETVAIHSNAMNKDITITVLLPEGYHEKKDLPVVYLLHGPRIRYNQSHALIRQNRHSLR